MTLKAALAGVLLTAMVGVWWWTLSQPTALPAGSPVRPAAASRSAAAGEAPPEVALDRLRGAVARAPIQSERDPFESTRSPRTSAVPAADGPGLPTALSDEAIAARPAWPRLELIGIAERTLDGAPVREAILATTRGVHHARAGDLVEHVYRVERVGADAIDVRLIPEDRTLRLALR